MCNSISQEFIELVREDKRLEAVRYAKKHFSAYEEGQLEDIQHCMGMLAFPKDTGMPHLYLYFNKIVLLPMKNSPNKCLCNIIIKNIPILSNVE